VKLAKKIFGILFVIAIVGIINVSAAHADDKEFKLKSFKITNPVSYDDEKINYEIESEGKYAFAAVWAESTYWPGTTSNDQRKYFNLTGGSYDYPVGSWRIKGLMIGVNVANPDNPDVPLTVVYYYSASDCDERQNATCVKFDLGDQVFTIKRHQLKQGEPEEFRLDAGKQITHPGQVITVDTTRTDTNGEKLANPKEITYVLLRFTNKSSGNSFETQMNGDNSIVIPSNAEPDTYEIDYCDVKYADGYHLIYPYDSENNGYVSCYGTVEVTKAILNKDIYTFNYSDYSKRIDNDLNQLNDNAEINVNATSSPVIGRTLFEKIKDTGRMLNIDYQNVRWSFYGKDIDNPKALEVSTSIGKLSDKDKENFKNSDLSKSILMEFTDNGNLPGKALIRVRSDDIKQFFEADSLYIYHYDDVEKTVSKVAMNVEPKGGYFEFYINHNSKYILTAIEMVDEEEVIIQEDPALTDNEELIDSYRVKEDKTMMYIFIAIGVGVLLLAIIVPIMLRKHEDKKNALTAEAATEDNGFFDTMAGKEDDEDGEGYIESMH
jgi:hypothetical protein